ncbi:hypothetical protein [Candidatus Contendibacter odensensis]|uniref:Uncharacterized protein n=1 Tax=Candidatus Contendobacter odensis Run_B_J11 TaxID=1400861 RepID=A0A7U7GG80_9GAMM|nr:hypothetical protein [Candidatus Contendobacter odensis]CDH47554.1 hypothetical protein BN874_840017 [Candidatus Contendobacter odensis Run_B_J11]
MKISRLEAERIRQHTVNSVLCTIDQMWDSAMGVLEVGDCSHHGELIDDIEGMWDWTLPAEHSTSPSRHLRVFRVMVSMLPDHAEELLETVRQRAWAWHAAEISHCRLALWTARDLQRVRRYLGVETVAFKATREQRADWKARDGAFKGAMHRLKRKVLRENRGNLRLVGGAK